MSKLRKYGAKRTSNKSSSRDKNVREIKGDQQFQKLVLEAEGPVAVDFWAPWCAPCKAQGPVFAKTAAAMEGTATFAKVNTEANQRIARDYGINSIPSLLVFLDGEVVDARVGLTNQSQLETMVRRASNKHNKVGIVDKVKQMFGAGAPA